MSETLTFGDFVNARRAANRICGWEDRATGAYVEMREKSIPDDKIIENMIDIEAQMWRILRDWESENLAAKD